MKRAARVHRREVAFAVVVLAVCHVSWAQGPSDARPQGQQEHVEVSAASPGAAAGTKEPAPIDSAAKPECTTCPAPELAVLIQKIDELPSKIKAAPQKAEPSSNDRWLDAKSVLLNILSNRIDSWFFANGKESVGFFALIAAAVAFGIAVIKLLFSAAMLNPSTPPTRWGRFKEWTRKSSVVRGVSVFIAALGVIYTGAALSVVLSARSSPEAVQSSIDSLERSLKSCQDNLATVKAPSPGAFVPAASLPAQEAMNRLRKSCEAAIAGSNGRMDKVQTTMTIIETKMPWAATKVFTFFAQIYLCVAVGYIIYRLIWD